MLSPTSSSELPFASLLVYSTRGVSEASLRSRRVAIALKKNATAPTSAHGFIALTQYFALRLAEELPRSPFPRWFDDAVLVPVPKSAPLKRGTLWTPMELATRMVALGMGRQVVPLLERHVAVPKSAFCAVGERPGPRQHCDSLRVTMPPSLGASRVVLVDDVITRGATMMGAAMRLRATLSSVEVTGFAALRAMSFDEVESMLSPCAGMISFDGDDRIERRP